jgi:hypothetical protein
VSQNISLAFGAEIVRKPLFTPAPIGNVHEPRSGHKNKSPGGAWLYGTSQGGDGLGGIGPSRTRNALDGETVPSEARRNRLCHRLLILQKKSEVFVIRARA